MKSDCILARDSLKNTHKVVECMLMGLKQSLLRGVGIGSMECIATAHAAHSEELQPAHFAAHYGHALKPIHLSFLA